MDKMWMAFLTAVAFGGFLIGGGFFMMHLEKKERLKKNSR